MLNKCSTTRQHSKYSIGMYIYIYIYTHQFILFHFSPSLTVYSHKASCNLPNCCKTSGPWPHPSQPLLAAPQAPQVIIGVYFCCAEGSLWVVIFGLCFTSLIPFEYHFAFWHFDCEHHLLTCFSLCILGWPDIQYVIWDSHKLMVILLPLSRVLRL